MMGVRTGVCGQSGAGVTHRVTKLVKTSPAKTRPAKTRPEKTRLDLLLVDRGLAASRERARALILAGRVLVSEQKIDKPGAPVAADAGLRLLGEDQPYVSRGGLKLAAALAHWPIAVAGRVCLDVGASTGGFTDCLLQHGASQVTAIDTGFGQIAMKLRNDPRVRLMERTNARLLEAGSLGPRSLKPGSLEPGSLKPAPLAAAEGEQGKTLLVMDVSFISATLILPAVFAAATSLVEAVILVKPQFEAGREHVGKGGIVRDPEAHELAIRKVADCVQSLGWQVVETIPSPITGAEGNKEFLLYAKRS
jgi:23S rRNA (cytidine1920-2'-O)/16S rRNA (cytidine1409-2'-O)-methyltransferase